MIFSMPDRSVSWYFVPGGMEASYSVCVPPETFYMISCIYFWAPLCFVYAWSLTLKHDVKTRSVCLCRAPDTRLFNGRIMSCGWMDPCPEAPSRSLPHAVQMSPTTPETLISVNKWACKHASNWGTNTIFISLSILDSLLVKVCLWYDCQIVFCSMLNSFAPMPWILLYYLCPSTALQSSGFHCLFVIDLVLLQSTKLLFWS